MSRRTDRWSRAPIYLDTAKEGAAAYDDRRDVASVRLEPVHAQCSEVRVSAVMLTSNKPAVRIEGVAGATVLDVRTIEDDRAVDEIARALARCAAWLRTVRS